MGKRRFYTPAEVAEHCAPQDCWVSIFGTVYDVSELLKEQQGSLAQPLIAAAGTDISHWFDAKTGDVKLHVDPGTNLLQPYCPQGRFLHVPPAQPAADWDSSFALPWWQDAAKYRVGALSSGTRNIRIKNVLTDSESTLQVPREETVADIRERYLDINSHASSYNWMALQLDLNKTLEENGVTDDDVELAASGLPADGYVSVLHLHFCDDLS
eukprot:jgi/Astpho2/6785/fgenesh1_pm.00103_%23_5_t